MSRLRADALLLLAAFIWGVAFIAQKYGNASMPPVMFGGVRFGLAMLAILPLARREARKHKKPLTSNDWRLALLVGCALFVAISMQQIALLTTTATNAGFLTSIYMVLVPFAAWAVQGIKPRPLVLFACAVCLTGAWFLTEHGIDQAWTYGDVLVLVSDLIWAFHVALISKFLAHTPRPFFLSVVQYGVAGALGLAAGLVWEPVTLEGIRHAMPAILYAGFVSGGGAYTLQIIGQRYTPAAEAALILSLEGVFAAISGAIVFGERLTFLAAIGCALILGGIVMVEIGPILRRR